MDSVLFILRGGRVFDEHAVFIMMFKIKKNGSAHKILVLPKGRRLVTLFNQYPGTMADLMAWM